MAPRARAPRLGGLLLLAWLCAACAVPPFAAPRFRIAVVDATTGRGIPAVELRTTDARLFVTDSAGVIAISDPDLLGRPVYFEVKSFGYDYPSNFLGQSAVVLDLRAGGATAIALERVNIAERLYRLTGSGIYRDSLLLRERAGPRTPAEFLVPTGMDSALATLYRGELFWIWGDTMVLTSPVANFRSTGARSRLPQDGGLDPNVGIDFRYFRDGERLRQMVDDRHPVIWLAALRAARDATGNERLFATYQKIEGFLQVSERGLVEFDDAREVFEVVERYPASAPIVPGGHSYRASEGGRRYVYYDLGVRSPDSAESIRDPGTYEAFTPLRPGQRFEAGGASALERDARGALVWGWKRDTAPLALEQWSALLRERAVRERDALYKLVDVGSGETVVPHNGSIAWNAHRRRWIMIRGQAGGSASFLGEIYYFEADGPLGPWAYGQKIVTHSRAGSHSGAPWREKRETYTFYNPVQHPELDRDGGRTIFFEGTFTDSFAKPPAPRVPGYDYNQMMYRLDLDDPRLFLPVAVYRKTEGELTSYRTGSEVPVGDAERWELAFFAPDRPRAGTLPVSEAGSHAGRRLILGDAGSPALFYCAPLQGPVRPATLPLYELRDSHGRWTYTTEVPAESAQARELCRVWEKPVDFPPLARTPLLPPPS